MAITSRVPDCSVERIGSTRRMSRQRRILAVVFVVSFALDFKGVAGGSPLLFLMAGLNSIAFLLLAVSYRMTLPTRGLASLILWGWGCFLAIGTLGALINAAPFNHYIRIAYTFTLFLEGFLVAWWTARDPRDAKLIVSAMMAAAVVSLFFTLGWGFYFSGESVGKIRYQILSPLIPLLIVVAGYDLFFARRRRLGAFFLLVTTLGIIALSVTRGMLLIVGFVAALVLLAVFWNASRTARFPRSILRVAFAGAILLTIGLAATILFDPDVLGRWVHRGLGAAHDATFWTRVAAIVGQFDSLIANPPGWLTGQGFGSSYPWPVSDFPWILKYMGPHAIGRFVWFPGEFMWMPFLFYGGFIIGPIAALVLLAGAVRAFRSLTTLLSTQSWRNPQAHPLWVGVLGYFAFLAMGFTADPFILRLAALFMGLCLGLVVTNRNIQHEQAIK